MTALIGSKNNQVSTNGMLGGLAFQSPETLTVRPQASVAPLAKGEMVFQLTNDTTLLIKVLGADGVLRSTTLTLA